jgi:hypothetical protein
MREDSRPPEGAEGFSEHAMSRIAAREHNRLGGMEPPPDE